MRTLFFSGGREGGEVRDGTCPDPRRSPAQFMIRRLLILWFTVSRLSAGPVIVPAAAQPEFSRKLPGIVGLSGLAWCRGDLYYAVSDRQRALLPLRITLDPASGRITAVKMESPVPLPSPLRDYEDIACDAARGRVFLSTEAPPALAAFSLKGRTLPAPVLPRVFQSARRNLGMESLTRDTATGRFWTANEDTLPADGAISNDKSGGLVRLQEFAAAGQPTRQFAWRTETSGLRLAGSGTGVTALGALPGGELIVMERVVMGISLEVRLYLAGFTGATDTSQLPALAGAKFTPAQKTLLFKKATGLTNYEGLATGPLLAGGSRALILVADSGSADTHTFLALRLEK